MAEFIFGIFNSIIWTIAGVNSFIFALGASAIFDAILYYILFLLSVCVVGASIFLIKDWIKEHIRRKRK